MFQRNDSQSRRAALSVNLKPKTSLEHEALMELEGLLSDPGIDEPSVLTPRELSIDRAAWFAPESPTSDRQQRVATDWKPFDRKKQPSFGCSVAKLQCPHPCWIWRRHPGVGARLHGDRLGHSTSGWKVVLVRLFSHYPTGSPLLRRRSAAGPPVL